MFFFTFGVWNGQGGKNGIAFVGLVGVSILIVLRVQILGLDESAWLAVIMGDMMVCICIAAVAAA